MAVLFFFSDLLLFIRDEVSSIFIRMGKQEWMTAAMDAAVNDWWRNDSTYEKLVQKLKRICVSLQIAFYTKITFAYT